MSSGDRRGDAITADQHHQRCPAVIIIGHKNSGKTTLLEHLVRHLTDAGVRAAAIKHTSDQHGFDKPHSDSDRMKRAGALAVGLVAPDEIGLYASRTPDTSETWLETVLRDLPEPPELILYEGYRGGAYAKIECILNPEMREPSITPAEGLIGVVSDHAITTDVPVLAFDAIADIAALIYAQILRR